MSVSRSQLLNASPGLPVSAEAFAEAMKPFAVGKRLAVAVSGGADSMALTLLASEWSQRTGVEVTALTVDHRLRDASTTEAATVGTWMQSRGIAHTILNWRDGEAVRLLGRSAQDAARDARLGLLTQWCRANTCQTLLLAHHADDQVETFFMRLARGSGLNGLGGIDVATSFNQVRLIRPLLAFSKSDLEETCRAANQVWIDDPSNDSAKYTRTRFRRARAIMESEGFTRERVLSTIAHLQRAKAALSQFVSDLHAAACIWSLYGSVAISASKLFAAPEDVSLRLLSDLLRSVGGQTYGPRFEALRRVHAKLQAQHVKTITLHGCCISREGDSISLCREPSAVREAFELVQSQPMIWDGRFEFTFSPELSGRQLLRVRPYDVADKIWWKDHGGWGALADIPSRIRRSLPVIEDQAGPIGMPHAGVWRADMTDIVIMRHLGPERVSGGFSAETQGD